jgi:hypothetical protein
MLENSKEKREDFTIVSFIKEKINSLFNGINALFTKLLGLIIIIGVVYYFINKKKNK